MLEPVQDAACWTPTRLRSDPSWMHHLCDREVRQLRAACRTSRRAGHNACNVGDRERHADSELARRMAGVSHALEEGVGVAVIKGVPTDDAEHHARDLYQTLLGFLGTLRPQSIYRDTLTVVEDEGTTRKRSGAKHALSIPVHNDGCDVAGLMCVGVPERGGTSILVSAGAVHDAMVRECPDALRTLYQPYVHAWQSYRYPNGLNDGTSKLPRTWTGPIFSVVGNKLCCRYSRHFTEQAQGFSGVAKMSRQQVDALDAFDSYLNDVHRWQFRFELQRGDVLLVNDFVILHSRTAFFDSSERRRKLYRAWLAVPNSRPLADSMRAYYGHTEPGTVRGGMLDEFMVTSSDADRS